MCFFVPSVFETGYTVRRIAARGAHTATGGASDDTFGGGSRAARRGDQAPTRDRGVDVVSARRVGRVVARSARLETRALRSTRRSRRGATIGVSLGVPRGRGAARVDAEHGDGAKARPRAARADELGGQRGGAVDRRPTPGARVGCRTRRSARRPSGRERAIPRGHAQARGRVVPEVHRVRRLDGAQRHDRGVRGVSMRGVRAKVPRARARSRRDRPVPRRRGGAAARRPRQQPPPEARRNRNRG